MDWMIKKKSRDSASRFKVFIYFCFIILFSQFSHAVCASPAAADGTFQWFPGTSDIQYCKAGTWTSLQHTITGSSCSTQGQIIYQSSKLQFCNGSFWVDTDMGTGLGTIVSTCSGSTAGTIRYDSSDQSLQVCSGGNWIKKSAGPATEFIMLVRTSNPGSSTATQFRIPTTGAGYNYTVNWGDGNTDTGQTGTVTHTYSSSGDYVVKISGSFPRIYFNNGGDRRKVLQIQNWGNIAWTNMASSFHGCSNMTITATDAPILTGVTNLSTMFRGASAMNSSLNNWNVSTITNMASMFEGATAFNGNITSWNTANVTSMTNMFTSATNFNQNIGSWNVGNVTSFRNLFWAAPAFNQNIGSWNVSSANDMAWMFEDATAFNQNIGSWNTSSATDMNGTFAGATSFNQNIGSWNTSLVTNMTEMFNGATNFNQDLKCWDVIGITSEPTSFATSSALTGGNKPVWASDGSGCSGGYAGPRLAQMREKQTSGSASSIATDAFYTSTTTGNTLICFANYQSTTQSILTLATSAGDSLTRIRAPTTYGGSGYNSEIWIKENMTGGSSFTATANFTASFSGGKNIVCMEYSNVPTSSVVNVNTVNSGNSNTGTVSGTTDTANQKGIIFMVQSGCVSYSGVTSGFKKRTGIDCDALWDGNIPSAGSFNFSSTISSSVQWQQFLITIRAP